MFSRRNFGLSIVALGLAACSGGGSRPTASSGAGARTAEPAFRAVPNAGYDRWIAGFRARGSSYGLSEATLNTGLRAAGYIPEVIERDRNQTESTRTLEDYISIAASDERVAKGRAAFARHRSLLAALEARYGVDAQIVTAVWGLESKYGERRGTIPVIASTSTLAFDGRRGAFFEKQLVAALKIIQKGDTSPEQMVGSWAGAMGHTQFIPTSYEIFAVDFNGDGRRDIWSDDPTDSLASTAAYLSKSGWRRGQSWGTIGGSGARTIRPQAGGPAVGVNHNFNVIKRYNNSDLYAIGVGHLADRIAGAGPVQASFPPDKYGLTKADRIRLQERLNALGYNAGTPDGVIGSGTETAISAYQAANGLPVTGAPSRELLGQLGA